MSRALPRGEPKWLYLYSSSVFSFEYRFFPKHGRGLGFSNPKFPQTEFEKYGFQKRFFVYSDSIKISKSAAKLLDGGNVDVCGVDESFIFITGLVFFLFFFFFNLGRCGGPSTSFPSLQFYTSIVAVGFHRQLHF